MRAGYYVRRELFSARVVVFICFRFVRAKLRQPQEHSKRKQKWMGNLIEV